MTLLRQGSGGQALPVARDDGYYLVDHGVVTFVPLQKPSALVLAFLPQRPPRLRFVSRRSDRIEEILDEIDGYDGHHL